MSIPFLKITCDGCSFSGSSSATFGLFLWSDKEQVFPIDRQLGVCEICDEIVAMEYLPDSKVVEQARGIRQKYAGPPLWRHDEKNEAKYLASQADFDLFERIIALKRPPVCLTCGGSSVHPIKLPESADRDVPIDLDIKHLGCSGHLRVQGSGGLRMGIRPITRWYDIFGKFLDESSEIPSMPPFPLPPSEPAFVNPSTTKAPDFEKIKKSHTSYNKNWKPDWSLEREVVRIESDDENYETFDEIEVFEEENGFFRLYETPLFSENLRWGDLIHAERGGEGVLWFLSFVERPDYEHSLSILSGTGENSFVEKNQNYLNAIMDAGGFWQLDMGGMLTTIVPHGFQKTYEAKLAAEPSYIKKKIARGELKAPERPIKATRSSNRKKKFTAEQIESLIKQLDKKRSRDYKIKQLEEEKPEDNNKLDWDIT